MKRPVLKVSKREIFGKKLKALRRDGILPANIYGKDIKSLAVQLPIKEFRDLYKEVGATGLIDVQVEGEKNRPVLIHDVHMDHINQVPLHADFFQVNLKEKVTTMVPVTLVGEPKAVAEKIGELLQTLNEIEVEALPADLPEKFEVDVTSLSELDAQITVADLKVPDGVRITSEPTSVVAKIAAKVEEQEPTVEETPIEGEAVAEGETKEESSEEKKEQ